MAKVLLDDVWKIYPGNVEAAKEINLEIKDHEFMVLVGPSGCGKSTTLRMVAGLEEISRGTITIGDRVINDVPPKDRDIAMVFQNYALYPHMTVYNNLAFGLKLRKYKKAEIDKRVREAADILDIAELLERRPKALSGGQRQRVAVGRAIVRKPSAFLFDEPLSNLDAKMRVQMRVEIGRLHHQLDTTMIYVTHDQTEAMTMGDRITVMKDGLIQQVAEPTVLYDNPANRFVAGFIGTPPMNFYEGHIARENGGLVFNEGGFAIPVPTQWQDALGAYADKPIVFGARPEDVGSAQAEQVEGAPRIRAKVDVVEPMGSETYCHLNTGKTTFISRMDAHRECAVGEEMDLAVYLGKSHFFDPETDKTVDLPRD
ncbi:MAG: sn-glycerol-3-phosphate ABC transporter ATP-binding protein UgpC [Kiritimatiellae bacterium]|nr:sn-glycerol-3-phosphate ABC transporter ATP-binding protein UgpC [Kiritimatiellia bacterium]